jgi:predicted PolB exonuclease-like 3'-5' exonuclease
LKPARTIVLDIETHRTRDAAVIARLREEAFGKAPLKGATKEEKLDWHTEKSREERFAEVLDKTAVDPMQAEILCIVVAQDDHSPVRFAARTPGEEADMLREFSRVINLFATPETIWVGHNLEGFDLPVLINRFRRLGVEPPDAFPVYLHAGGRYHGRVFDTMKRTPGRNPFISMEAACEVCGITLSQTMWRGEPMHGGRVGEAYAAGYMDVILDYCAGDVLDTRELYNRLTFGDRWGTFPKPSDLGERLEEIEADPDLSPAQKALTQKSLLKSAGAWPK